MNKFLRLAEDHNPEKSEYKIILKSDDGVDHDSIDVSGTSYAFDIFRDIKTVIKAGEDIVVPSEDEGEPILKPDDREAIELGTALSVDPTKRVLGKDPKKTLGKAIGDLYLKVADKIKNIANI
tara:strand:- start:811 stop:1179 length:369 start_codon:yes stop_codon:yes gene_type:complete